MTRAQQLGIDPVLVTCDEDNAGSRRTIEKAGGELEDIREGKRRYWIGQGLRPVPAARVPCAHAVRIPRS